MKNIFSLILIMLPCCAVVSAQQQAPRVDIYYHVPFIPQPTGVSCWSSSMAMILWWRDNEDAQACLMDAQTPQQVETNIGYWNQYFGRGLPGTDVRALETLGFEPIPPISFDVAGLQRMMANGPMWIAYDGCSNPLTACNHAVVLVGLQGDGTPNGTSVILHDPDDGSGTYPNLGVRDNRMPFNEFTQRLTSRALRVGVNSSGQVRTIHFMARLRH